MKRHDCFLQKPTEKLDYSKIKLVKTAGPTYSEALDSIKLDTLNELNKLIDKIGPKIDKSSLSGQCWLQFMNSLFTHVVPKMKEVVRE